MINHSILKIKKIIAWLWLYCGFIFMATVAPLNITYEEDCITAKINLIFVPIFLWIYAKVNHLMIRKYVKENMILIFETLLAGLYIWGSIVAISSIVSSNSWVFDWYYNIPFFFLFCIAFPFL